MTIIRFDGADARAEATRQELRKLLARARKLTTTEAARGRNFCTDDGYGGGLTVTMSVRQAFSLIRVLGPIGLQNGDGSYTRLFAAMNVCQRQLMRAKDGRSLAVVAALQVLQAAINDHLWYCRDVPQPGGKVRPRRRPPLKPAVEDDGS